MLDQMYKPDEGAANLKPQEPTWVWLVLRDSREHEYFMGYGYLTDDGKPVFSHRGQWVTNDVVSWLVRSVEPPAGHELDSDH